MQRSPAFSLLTAPAAFALPSSLLGTLSFAEVWADYPERLAFSEPFLLLSAGLAIGLFHQMILFAISGRFIDTFVAFFLSITQSS